MTELATKTRCRHAACRAPIAFGLTAKGKRMPLDVTPVDPRPPGLHGSHPDPSGDRRRRRRARALPAALRDLSSGRRLPTPAIGFEPVRDASEPKGNGRKVNRGVIRAYWLALPEPRRTFTAVADRFGCSDVRVGQIAREDGWAKLLEEHEAAEAREMQKALVREVRRRARSRVDRLLSTLELYDRVNDVALDALPIGEDGKIIAGELRLESLLASMPGLFKMAELAAGEATDRVAIADVQPVLVAFARIAVLRAPAADRGEVMRELEAASAGLVVLEAGG